MHELRWDFSSSNQTVLPLDRIGRRGFLVFPMAGSDFLFGEEQGRNYGCRCGYCYESLFSTLIVCFLFFLGWKILETRFHCKDLQKKLNAAEEVTSIYLRRGSSQFAETRDCCNSDRFEFGKDHGCGCCRWQRQSKIKTSVSLRELYENDQSESKMESANAQSDDDEKLYGSSDEGIKLNMEALKKAVKMEQGYRAAAYLELEKERKAAASAAQEAMMMILKLQNEKGRVEMQLRQLRREFEQKRLYDHEVVTSLREIVAKQDEERRFLDDELVKFIDLKCRGSNAFNVGSSDEEDIDNACNSVDTKLCQEGEDILNVKVADSIFISSYSS